MASDDIASIIGRGENVKKFSALQMKFSGNLFVVEVLL